MKKRGAPADPANIQRALDWGYALLCGTKISQLARSSGFSHQYITQALKQHCNLTPADRPRPTPDHHRLRHDAPFPKRGCTRGQYRMLRDSGVTLKYKRHRNSARQRGIDWHFNLWTWWMAWQASGRWSQRGRGAENYAMCRRGDVGPYALENVYFATNAQNSADMQLNRKARAAVRPALEAAA